MKKILILSRFKEDVSWINSCCDKFEKIFIFNKSSDLIENIKCKNIIICNLKNVGRETDTYLRFIIDYYDMIVNNKDEYIYIFSQAYPFDNSPNFLQNIDNFNFEKDTFLHLSNIKASEPKFAVKMRDISVPNGLPIINYYNHLFFKENMNLENETFLIFCNGLWMVSSKNLLFRKIEFYKYCLSLLKTSINPYEGFVFERLWQFIFDGETLDWISHYDKIREKYAVGSYKNLRIE